MSRAWVFIVSLGLAACTSAAPRPVEPRLGEDACAHCRMTLVSTATAAQVVAPGAEPLFFDDLACARDYLLAHAPADDAVVFAADHRTGGWHDARDSILTRTAVATPMGSGVVAHADRESRDADPEAVNGETLPAGWLPAGAKAGKDGAP